MVDNYNVNKYGVQRPAYEEQDLNYVNYGTNANWNNCGCKLECNKCCKCRPKCDQWNDWKPECNKCCKCRPKCDQWNDWKPECNKCCKCRPECDQWNDWKPECNKCCKCRPECDQWNDWKPECNKCCKCRAECNKCCGCKHKEDRYESLMFMEYNDYYLDEYDDYEL